MISFNFLLRSGSSPRKSVDRRSMSPRKYNDLDSNKSPSRKYHQRESPEKNTSIFEPPLADMSRSFNTTIERKQVRELSKGKLKISKKQGMFKNESEVIHFFLNRLFHL